MRIALLSLDQVWEDKQANLSKVTGCISKAAARECDIIIFPEMTLTGFSMNIFELAECYNESPTVQHFSALSKEYGIAIIFGVVFKHAKKATNDAVLVKPTGEIVKYTKIHPFSFVGEDNYYASGDKIVSASLNGYDIGITICYDLRFPELYSILAQRCPVIVNIANWPKKRVDHWLTLLKARAIEQQVFMIGVNRTGKDGIGLEYEKSSCIFDPNGAELMPMTSKDEMDIFEVNLQQLAGFRNAFSTRQDRKVKFYIENY